MRRTKRRNKGPADAILTADLHLTDSTPVSRTDDYIQAQKRKLEFLQSLSDENDDCPILCAGDVFDKWKASPWLIAWAYHHLPTPMIAIPGNHDLPMHSLQYYEKSALHVMDETIPNLTVLQGNGYCSVKDRRIIMLHELVWPGSLRSLQEVAGGTSAKELLSRYEGEFDLILTGDNHTPFVERKGNTLLVNPGSMMRSTADQIDHRPRCYLYYAKDNSVKPAYFPIEQGVINREHIEKKQERDERISAYIERMSQGWKAGLSFRQNLEAFFQENKVPQKVRDVIWEHLEVERI